MKIYTSYYGNVRNLSKEGIVPISISLSLPKFLNPKPTRVFLLAPSRDMLGMEYDAYKKKYLAKLEKVDWKLVKSILENNSDNDSPVALCCYESLKAEDDWCHRTMLADYINEYQKELFGEVIEFKKPTEIPKPKSTQTKMF